MKYADYAGLHYTKQNEFAYTVGYIILIAQHPYYVQIQSLITQYTATIRS